MQCSSKWRIPPKVQGHNKGKIQGNIMLHIRPRDHLIFSFHVCEIFEIFSATDNFISRQQRETKHIHQGGFMASL